MAKGLDIIGAPTQEAALKDARLWLPDNPGQLIVPTPEPKQVWERFNPGVLASTVADLGVGSATTAFSAANQFFTKVPIVRPFTSTSLIYQVVQAGVTITNCFMTWYDSSGAKILQSADQSAIWTSTGVKTLAFAVTPVWRGADTFAWLCMYFGTAATTPGFLTSGLTGALTGPNATLVNAGSTTANRRFGSLALANTATMPANITPTTMAANTGIICAALV